MFKLSLLSVMMLFHGFISVSQAQESVGESAGVVVFDNAKSEIPYRIPALSQTRDGTLLAVCDLRYNGADIGIKGRKGSFRIDQVLKTSRDNGKTWSEEIRLLTGDDRATALWRVAFGDPAIVADRTSDEVFLACVSGTIPYYQSTWQNPIRLSFFRSMDGGKSWDKGKEATNEIYGLYGGKLAGGFSPCGIFLTSGKIMQSRKIKVGKYYRLYIAHPTFVSYAYRYGVFVIYSDDFGRTWQVLGPTTIKASDASDESKVEELPDGSVLLSCRNQKGGRKFNVFTYTDVDHAKGYWSKDEMPENMTANEINACNGEILILPARRNADGKHLFVALQSVPLSKKREDVGFFYKEINSRWDYNTGKDMAFGWIKGSRVSRQTSCYSTMVQMHNKHIGLLFEENEHNSGYNIVFRDLTLGEITGGKYSAL